MSELVPRVIQDAADEAGVTLAGSLESYREEALYAIQKQCTENDKKWGGFAHDAFHGPEQWLAILMKHTGHYAQAILGWKGYGPKERIEWFKLMRREALHIAAVLVVVVEQIDMRIDTAIQQDAAQEEKSG